MKIINDITKAWDFVHKNNTFYDTSEEDLIHIFSFLKAKHKHKVLDMGCGKVLSANLAKRNDLDFYGCDISSFAINNFKKKNINNSDKIIVADSCYLPWDENFFDSIISIRSLDSMSFEEAQASVSEANRILKSKGTLLAVLKMEQDSNFTRFFEDIRTPVNKSKEIILNTYTRLKISRLFEPLFEIRRCNEIALNSLEGELFWLVDLEKR